MGNVSISRNAKMLRVLLPRNLRLSAKILRIFSPSQQNISIVEARRTSATTPREAGSSFETC